MPLLLCPNDNGPMQTVNRSGVEFDICPTCRGVWLDRGELEKLMSAGRDDASGERSSFLGDAARPRSDDRRYDRDDDRDRDRQRERRDWDDDDHRQKKRRGSGIFDIFD